MKHKHRSERTWVCVCVCVRGGQRRRGGEERKEVRGEGARRDRKKKFGDKKLIVDAIKRWI